MSLGRWKKRGQKLVADNPWWEYRRDAFELPDGKEGEYHYVHTPGSVMIVPVLDDGRFVLVRQYRYLNDKDSIEFPAGGIKSGFNSLQAAQRELKEETGYCARVFETIGRFNPFNGVTDELCTVYVASGLEEGEPEPDETEEFELLTCTEEEVISLARSGELWDGMSLAAWSLYSFRLLLIGIFLIIPALTPIAAQPVMMQPVSAQPVSAQPVSAQSVSAQPSFQDSRFADVRTGGEVLLRDSLHLLRGKRVGLICNHTALLRDGRHLIDVLVEERDVSLVAIFTPEHGLDGWTSAGVEIPSSVYRDIPVESLGAVSGSSSAQETIPLHSLYGRSRKPTLEMLDGVDLLLFDMQDVGARFYTYISTMVLCMQAAAEAGIPMLILDRPNPLGGVEVEGPVIDDTLRSFAGLLPIPVRHGLTIGELALMVAGENWMDIGQDVELRVIQMQGWKRTRYFRETGLKWIRPSPNMPDPETALLYPGTCLLEGSNVSEGRGTERPFLMLGAPFVDGTALAAELNRRNLPGIHVEEVTFTPESRPGAVHPRFQSRRCSGVNIILDDPAEVRPFRTGLEIIAALIRLHGDKVRLTSYFDLLTGFAPIRELLRSGQDIETITAMWSEDKKAFLNRRMKYLIYP